MRPADQRHTALALAETGLTALEIARRTGIPRSTVRDWLRPGSSPVRCPRCWRAAHKPVLIADGDYAELLGLYLGDGCLAQTGRAMRLRLALDAKYPGIIRDARALLQRCFPENPVGTVRADAGSTVVLSVYSIHLTCLLPQHGPGKKHHRAILLEPWQTACVDAFPWRFIRGCIRSDGCFFINRTGPYEYPSYEFRNYSSDILRLFAHACDVAGVAYRLYEKRVRICQRPSVALMTTSVGFKQ